MIIERMFTLKSCFSKGFMKNFSKEIVQAKYLMDFCKEKSFNSENELIDEIRLACPRQVGNILSIH